MSNPKMMNLCSVRLPDSQMQQFESACYDAGLNTSDALRLAINLFIKKSYKIRTTTRGNEYAGRNNEIY